MFRAFLLLLTSISLSANPKDLVLHTEIPSSKVKVDLFIPKRAHAIWAEYEIDGQKAATNPALICVKDSPGQSK